MIEMIKPMHIIGSAVLEHEEGAIFCRTVRNEKTQVVIIVHEANIPTGLKGIIATKDDRVGSTAH